MKFSRGFAPDIKKMACMRPRTPPITKAEEADGIYLLPFSSVFPVKDNKWNQMMNQKNVE